MTMPKTIIIIPPIALINPSSKNALELENVVKNRIIPPKIMHIPDIINTFLDEVDIFL
ncbi:MAG: hypothetical protein KGD63_11720 [Candidatus Lokiarchaeota archaeon]|nr:hypothetical protein [Candidatus Lokiarchaeota archaeon]